ncbi:MAG: endo alpha-1,4 polygalactosaminidase [Nanoarchaeota archaeon]|nr:endo alpha-1,4 polygalactosaminidase [Nanoarchaeota archaeon]
MKRIILTFVLLILLGCEVDLQYAPQEMFDGTVEISGQVSNVVVADTDHERSRGLMYKEKLCDDCGMLFVYDDMAERSFWMKNTLIPLDILFIDPNQTVVDVVYAMPCESEPCETFHAKAKYVLEVNGGRFDNSIIGSKAVSSLFGHEDSGLSDTVSKNMDKEKARYKPKPGVSWYWQLNGEIDTSHDVEIYDIDLFDSSKSLIDQLHGRGVKVICYFSAGTYEDWRSDSGEFPSGVLGKDLDDWPGEVWLDISHYLSFAEIMGDRLDLAVQKGCDGVEPDNVDGFQNDNGFVLTYAEQLEYNLWLAEQAHNRGLAIALKNDLSQVPDLVDSYDLAINEQCFYYEECELLLPFIEQDKAVLGIEYELDTDNFCEEANDLGFSWLKAEYELDGNVISCLFD